jgi:hypothetical protein
MDYRYQRTAANRSFNDGHAFRRQRGGISECRPSRASNLEHLVSARRRGQDRAPVQGPVVDPGTPYTQNRRLPHRLETAADPLDETHVLKRRFV